MLIRYSNMKSMIKEYEEQKKKYIEELNISLKNFKTKFSSESFHRNNKGLLEFDIKKRILTFQLTGPPSEEYIKIYGKTVILSIHGNIIEKIDKNTKEIENKACFRILTNKKILGYENFIFSFRGENRNQTRDKFINLIIADLKYYLNKFKFFPLYIQKQICFLFNNDYINKLFYQIYAYYKEPYIIINYIYQRYPDKININITKNKSSLSNYCINQSSSFLRKSYNENVVNNISFSLLYELEKDKYYYDPYETFYLYHNNHRCYKNNNHFEKIKRQINNFSISSIQDNNYSSSSLIPTNLLLRKFSQNRRNIINNNSYSNKRTINIIKNNNPKDIGDNLINAFHKMKTEFETMKEDLQSYYITKKAINDERNHLYEQYLFMSNDDEIAEVIIDHARLIKDMIFFYKLIKSDKKKKCKLNKEKLYEFQNQIFSMINALKHKVDKKYACVINEVIKNLGRLIGFACKVKISQDFS